MPEDATNKPTTQATDEAWLKTTLDALTEHPCEHPFVGFSTGNLAPAGALAPTNAHTLISAPTSVGKTRRVLAPATMMWDGPAVVVSSKPDLLAMTAQTRIANGGRDHTYVLDLSGKLKQQHLPDGAQFVSLDPTTLIACDDDALDIAAIMLPEERGDKDPFWVQSSQPLLAGLLRAAGTDGINWVIGAAGAYAHIPDDPLTELVEEAKQGLHGDIDNDVAAAVAFNDLTDAARERMSLWEPGLTTEIPTSLPQTTTWFTASLRLQLLGSHTLAAKLRSAVISDADRTIGSFASFCEKAVSPWLRSALIPGPNTTPLNPAMLTHPRASLFIVAPADGVVAPAAVVALDTITKRWRDNQIEQVTLPKLLLVIDELTNTAPWAKLPVVVTEARSMGINLLAAVQSTQQFARRMGHDGMHEMRRIFPSVLLMAGATEPEMLTELIHKHELKRQLHCGDSAMPSLPAGRGEALLVHNAPPTDDPAHFATYDNGLLVNLKDVSELDICLPTSPEGMVFDHCSDIPSPPDFNALLERFKQVQQIIARRENPDPAPPSTESLDDIFNAAFGYEDMEEESAGSSGTSSE